jgi:ribonuclease T2
LLPTDETSAALAPAWYDDDLGAHEWSKHGTCAAWSDANGAERGLDQEAYYDAMFELAKKEGTPEMLRNATGSSVSLKSLQDMFGGAGKVALGCTPKCELAQVVTCYSRGGEHGGPGERVDCPCFGVRDSHYDNSCAELHACEDVKVLSAAQTGCGGGGPPRPGPGPWPGPHHRTCRDGARCCPGVRGPTCESDADCETQSGCRRCSHSSSGGHRHCTDVKGE